MLEVVHTSLEVILLLFTLLQCLPQLRLDHLGASIILFQLLDSTSIKIIDNLKFADAGFQRCILLLQAFIREGRLEMTVI